MTIDVDKLEIELRNRELEEFSVVEDDDLCKLVMEKEFADFHEAMEYVNNLAELAEENNHHPDICIHYNKVMLELWTHSQNGVTELDLEFAELINDL